MAFMSVAGNASIPVLIAASAYLSAAGFVQDNRPDPDKAAPPPVRAAAALITPEATLAVAGDREIAAGGEAIWISSRAAGTVARVDAKTAVVDKTIAVGKDPCGPMIAGFGSLWVPLCGHGLARVDLKTHAVSATIPTPLAKTPALATAAGSIWTFVDDRGTLARIDPDTNAAVAEVYTDRGAALAAGADALWVISPSAARLTRVNPHTNLIVETIEVGAGPQAVVVADGAVWTLNAKAGSVSRVDVKTNKVTETIALGFPGSGGAIVSGAGSIWISRPGLPLARIDPRTNRLMQVFTGDHGGVLAFGSGSLWLAANATTIWRLDPRRVEATRPPR